MSKQRTPRSTFIECSSRKNKQEASECNTLCDDVRPTSVSFIDNAQTARQLVTEAWPDIVQGLIKKAIGGGYQQTKILLDLCNFASNDTLQINELEKQDLCDALLQGLGLINVRGNKAREKNFIDTKKNKKTT